MNVPLAALVRYPDSTLYQQKGKFTPQAVHLTLHLSLEAKRLHLQLFSFLILIANFCWHLNGCTHTVKQFQPFPFL